VTTADIKEGQELFLNANNQGEVKPLGYYARQMNEDNQNGFKMGDRVLPSA